MKTEPTSLTDFYFNLLYTDRYLKAGQMNKPINMISNSTNQQHVFIKMALKAWNSELARADQFIFDLSDEKWYNQVSPGRNRAIYLIGHLIASNDSLFEILGIGKRLYPELELAFIRNADQSDQDMPDPSLLKTYWYKVHEGLKYSFLTITDDEWLSRHTAMTDQDFDLDPMRNKLSVLMSRSRHLSYHLGQLKLIK